MLNPASLFVACLLTLATNPAFVSSVPLPSLPHRSPTSFLRHRSFESNRKLPTLRIVDDDQAAESVPWIQAFTEDSILPESIFADSDSIAPSLSFELASVHRPHNFRRDLPPPTRAQGSRVNGSSSRKLKRSLSETPTRKHEKRFSSRWWKEQAEVKHRTAAGATRASSTPSAVWSKVSTTPQSFATPTSSPDSSASSTPTSSTTSAAPSATPSSLSITGTHVGQGTWFAPGLGACGTVATDDSPIVAVSHLLYDQYPGATLNPNNNPICGQKIRATYQGKSVDVTVQDRCVGCAMWDLDFSLKLFGELADLAIGRLSGVEWSFI